MTGHNYGYIKKEDIRTYLLIASVVILLTHNILKDILFGIPVIHLGNLICYILFVTLPFYECRHGLNDADNRLKICIGIFAAFILWGSVSAIITGQGNVAQFLWAVRNYSRFFVIFIDCCLILGKKDLNLLYRVFNILLVLHVLITCIQFFAFGIRWDYLNGIFGRDMGGNSGLNILLVTNTCIILYRLAKGKINSYIFLMHIAWMCFNAAMAELKVYLPELLLLFVLGIILSGRYKEMLKLIPGMVVIFVLSIALMYKLYPVFNGFYTITGLTDSRMTGAADYHGNGAGIGRLSQISGMMPIVYEYMETVRGKSGVLGLLCGIGFGGAEYALSLPVLNSQFYQMYKDKWYFDFTLSFVYAETGFVGIVIWISFFIYILTMAMKHYFTKDRILGLFKIMPALMALGLMLYDVSLRNNYGYLIWVLLAVTFVMDDLKDTVKNE